MNLIDEETFQTMTTFVAIETLKKEVVRRKDTFMTKLDVHCIDLIQNPDFILPKVMEKLDQGALGMSDPCGTLPLALKPNAVPRINCLLSNFYFCAN